MLLCNQPTRILSGRWVRLGKQGKELTATQSPVSSGIEDIRDIPRVVPLGAMMGQYHQQDNQILK